MFIVSKEVLYLRLFAMIISMAFQLIMIPFIKIHFSYFLKITIVHFEEITQDPC